MFDSTFTIFTILSELRRGIPPSHLFRTFARFGVSLSPRLPFWLYLLRQAGLLDTANTFRPTRSVHAWLALPPKSQTLTLLDAWQSYPKDSTDRAARLSLLRRLKRGLILKSRDERDLLGLQALGICREGKINAWGRVVLLDDPEPGLRASAAWYIEKNALHVPFPPNWPLLWELEGFLRPFSPSKYSLQKAHLRRAAQWGESAHGISQWEQVFIGVLEKGLNASISPELRAAILGIPVLRVGGGTILEFSSAEELRLLRRSPVLRKQFDHILSPRHVYIEEQNAPHLLKMLEQRGIYTPPLAEESAEALHSHPRTYFHQFAVPQQVETPPSVTNLLSAYLRLQQALDILYHAPGGIRPENRRITPLLMEERSGHVYVIAYCHTRRAQRTFRLDRIEIM